MLTRRGLMKMIAAAPMLRASRALGAQNSTVATRPAPFTGERASLASYRVPDWFRDAKFGIWAHWGPQSAPEYGDWYARNMYMEGSEQYKYHVERYGHPSKFGFKDVIPTWKAEQFDPESLMRRYKKAGAKYFVSMGVHHDNFDLWNSKHTRWNAVNMGPKKDIVGLFQKAARAEGLRFGVSDHLWLSYKWLAVSHGSDRNGSYTGVPYDGADPRNADLYHDIQRIPPKLVWDDADITEAWKQHWFARIKDLVDQYQPDLLYCDGPIPFGEFGLNLVAHFYNASAQRNGGRVEAVYTSKRREDCSGGTCALDIERGIVDDVWPEPWQTDTCIGHWHYDKRAQYKSPKMIVDMLVDIVSRNGNLLLNFPLMSSGILDQNELTILDAITSWMNINSEGIYGTRPWKAYGTGPTTQSAAEVQSQFNERKRKDLTASDFRFTTKGRTLYAFCMGCPQTPVVVAPLGTSSPHGVGRITHVELLGFSGKLQWSHDQAGLIIQPPAERPCEHAVAFKITGAIDA